MTTEAKVLGLHVGTPALGLLPTVFPTNNGIGTQLAYALLAQALSHEGLLCDGGAGCCGVFNDCVMVFSVRDEIAAATAILGALQKLKLAPFCQIAVLSGGRWHCIHPSPDIPMLWRMDLERQELWREQLGRQIALLSGEGQKAE